MRSQPELIKALAVVQTIELRATLARLVPLGDLVENSPSDFLFTSGKPNRYNPAGIECVYFSEDESTARLEYVRRWAGLRRGKQPVVTYFAEVRLARVLDLTRPATRSLLGITPKELSKPWRGRATPTATQLIGQIVCRHSSIAAIRYASEAALEAGKVGRNVVIYRDQITKPDFVRILGPAKKPLQRWS